MNNKSIADFLKPTIITAQQYGTKVSVEIDRSDLDLDEVMDAYKSGTLKEVFGTGTAATISLIKELRYKDFVMEFDVTQWKTAPEIKERLDAIRYGKREDTHGWMIKV